MISKKMEKLVAGSSVIRAMFEEGKQMAAKYGAENVYDFSLGNPNVPAPAEVNEALLDIVKNTDSLKLHGYMSNAGHEEVR
jgi:aspartate aminotransferase